MQGRILFADNIKRFVKVRSEFLTNAGFEVLPAYSVEETEYILKNERIHLAILDIRLVDDDDELDQSGLILAKDKAYRQIPKIIHTGFPTVETVHKALGPDIEGTSSAVAFLAKHEGANVLVKTVEAVFEQYVHLNLNLTINWNHHPTSSFADLIPLLKLNTLDIPLSNYCNELEDLFRKLFYTHTHITIIDLISHTQNNLSLTIQAITEDNLTEQFIVICTTQEAYITAQSAIHQNYRINSQEETDHFVTIAYVLNS